MLTKIVQQPNEVGTKMILFLHSLGYVESETNGLSILIMWSVGAILTLRKFVKIWI